MRGAVDVVLQWKVGVGNRSIERDSDYVVTCGKCHVLCLKSLFLVAQVCVQVGAKYHLLQLLHASLDSCLCRYSFLFVLFQRTFDIHMHLERSGKTAMKLKLSSS